MSQTQLQIPSKNTYPPGNGKNLPTDIQGRLKDAVEKRNSGAVSIFTEQKAMELLGSIIEGSTVQQACDKVEISRATYYVWRQLVPGFLDMTTQAQELQADSMVDDNVALLENVDESGREGMAKLRKAEQVARFKFDLAKCLNFKKYGDKKQQFNLNVNAAVQPADISKWFNK